MKRYDMKRKLAAALALAMLSGCMPFAALAEGEATPSEPKTQTVETENKFTSVSAGGKNASSKTERDGAVTGSVSYSGETIAVVKLYTGAGDWVGEKEVGNGGGSYSFTGLAAGEYRVDFCLYNQGVKDSTTVTVGYEETPPTPPTPTEKTMTVDGFTVTNVSAEGKTDGRISGSVSYTGDSAVVVKLYAASDTSSSLQECEIHNGGGSFKFGRR